jgi:hypothetical protein
LPERYWNPELGPVISNRQTEERRKYHQYHREMHWVRRPDNVQRPLNNPFYAKYIDFMCPPCDGIRQRPSRTHDLSVRVALSAAPVHAYSLVDAPLPRRVLEEGPVRDCRLFRRDPNIPLITVPGVQVQIEMDY